MTEEQAATAWPICSTLVRTASGSHSCQPVYERGMFTDSYSFSLSRHITCSRIDLSENCARANRGLLAD